MLSSGLVSVSFRHLTAVQVVELAARAGLQGIEWGGDVHVPHGEVSTAGRVAAVTRDAGLQVAAYGSYYRVGVSSAKGLSFDSVIDCARAMHAPTVRVWAGERGGDQADADYWARVVDDARGIADVAASHGITVSFEHHAGTLTDTWASALRLFQRIAHPNVRLYWQPPVGQSQAQRLEGLSHLLPHVSHVHAFQWSQEAGAAVVRHPLADGAEEWPAYLDMLGETAGDHMVMLEFVRDDSAEQLMADAVTLKRWLAQSAARRNGKRRV